MEHCIDWGKVEDVAGRYIGLNKLEALAVLAAIEVVEMSREKGVRDDDLMVALKKSVDEMAANEAGAAGD